MAEKKNETLQKARKEMEYLTGDEEVQRIAELREKWEMDWNSSISYAKEEEKIKIAKEMIKEGIEIEKISKITGLSIEKIEKLKKQ